MSGRIRSIKPEFWTNEQTTAMSLVARLAFIGLWSFCDDGGNHPASAKTLKMLVFPGDDMTVAQVQALVQEMIEQGLLIQYEAEEKTYWHVTGWHKHQRIERPTYRYPPPPDKTENRRHFDDTSTTPRRHFDPGRECIGKERKGEGESVCNARAHEAENLSEKNASGGEAAAPPADSEDAAELSAFSVVHQAITLWGESDAGIAEIMQWKKTTGYRDSQHGKTTDEVTKFICWHLRVSTSKDLLRDPVPFFRAQFPGWLTNAKTMNRPPKKAPPNGGNAREYPPPPARRGNGSGEQTLQKLLQKNT